MQCLVAFPISAVDQYLQDTTKKLSELMVTVTSTLLLLNLLLWIISTTLDFGIPMYYQLSYGLSRHGRFAVPELTWKWLFQFFLVGYIRFYFCEQSQQFFYQSVTFAGSFSDQIFRKFEEDFKCMFILTDA